MSSRTVAFVVEPIIAEEAPGVTIRRTIGSDRLILLDPFLLLDHLTLGEAADEMGFKRHPHRGIETLTYVFTGGMHHRDSLGNDDKIQANESQFMTDGAGIFQEETPIADHNRQESLQIWFNLPASQKLKPATYRPARLADIPEVKVESATIRVVCGEIGGAVGPFDGVAVNPVYLDVQLPAFGTVHLPAVPGAAAFAYMISGSCEFEDPHRPASQGALAVLGDGDGVIATANSDCRFIYVSAMPLNEPVLQYRSLVMNTADQMGQAVRDLENGTFA